MAEFEDLQPEEKDEEFESVIQGNGEEHVIKVSGMYEEWFLDYASYVILERAVPHLHDGLKPVQRRILHSMQELDDGRYNKVANIVGNTMKYHPHGDASIADALVAMGQKDVLIDTQGNWGNIYTGDNAAAPRYIEARLTKFANEVVFNPKTTQWLSSYDGRNKEPVTLPAKFPLLLTSGAEGIAVGLSCKMLPHNFVEIIDASIQLLKGKRTSILPDFPTGGLADFSNYNDGERGGRVRIRARMHIEDKKEIIITEIPFGTTTSSLIDSILKANDKGKIKIKKIEDNTAENVEIVIQLHPGSSPDKTVDALYAFTDCEVSVSPNAVVIFDDKPMFTSVGEMLRLSTERTRELLKLELEIERGELLEQWHFASLEKIFIENKIYIKFDGLTYEEAIAITHKLLKPHTKHLKREVSDEDVKRLLELRMRRITKHDSDKADQLLLDLEEKLKQVAHNLEHLTEFAIGWFKKLKEKYAAGRERRTEIRNFENIDAAKVAVSNVKLYVNKVEGFAGYALKKGEGDFVSDCSDIDDIIIIRRDGIMQVSRISEKSFFGKDILYCGVWKKGDDRTIYNLIYLDGRSRAAFVKRFAVTSITRDKEYPLTTAEKGSRVLYLSVNPNGEAETVKILLRPVPKLKRVRFEFDFSQLAIKGRAAKGNMLSKHLIHKIEMKEGGVSTLSALKVYWDESIQRLNYDGRGNYIGAFAGDDKILTIHKNGFYKLSPFADATKFDEEIILMEKYNPEQVYSMIYWEAAKKQFFVKRFQLEPTDKKQSLVGDIEGSYVEMVTSDATPRVFVQYDKRGGDRADDLISLPHFISVKGQKALGNRLTPFKVKSINILEPIKPLETAPEPNRDIAPPEFPSTKSKDDIPPEGPVQITLEL
jgi:topoisomerase-4 subunit A